MAHLLETRYRDVWERVRTGSNLSEGAVAASRFYFEFESGTAVPKRFDTYAIVCGLPFRLEIQRRLQSHWQQSLALLGSPLSRTSQPAH